MMDINMDLLQCFIRFSIKKILVVVFKMKIFLNKQLAEELHEPIIRKITKKKFIHLLLVIFGVQI